MGVVRSHRSIIYFMAEAQHSLEIIKQLEAKLARGGGVVRGFHGTSASNAKAIERVGLTNQLCVEGETGVWFWDEDVAQNAAYNAQRKARETGDSQGAVIEGNLRHPRPDQKGRKQWLANASDVEITGIKYMNLD